MFSYWGCRYIFSGISISSLNPTVAFSIWIYSLSVFDHLKANAGGDTMFETLKLGKYVWVYMLAGGFAPSLSYQKILLLPFLDNSLFIQLP